MLRSIVSSHIYIYIYICIHGPIYIYLPAVSPTQISVWHSNSRVFIGQQNSPASPDWLNVCLNLFVHHLLFCALLFFLLLFLSVSLLTPEEDFFFFLSKSLAYYCFLVFRRIGEYISLDLFNFVNLTSSCSLTSRLSARPRSRLTHTTTQFRRRG